MPHHVDAKYGPPQTHKGHCNGPQYVITRLHTNIIEAEISGGSSQGNRLFIGGDVTVRFVRFTIKRQTDTD